MQIQQHIQNQNHQPNLNLTKLKPYKAIRMVDTKKLSYKEWLDYRKQGIGSSDAPSAIGLNPYKSELELWLDKTGKKSNASNDDNLQPVNELNPMFWGTVLEPIVANYYSKVTGNKVKRVNAILQHSKYPWMLANLDREVVGSDDVQILECKTAGMNGAKLWRNGVPEYVKAQVMHQLAVTGKKAADVAVLIAGQEFRYYRINRDDKYINNLIELESIFWSKVKNNIEPIADETESSANALKFLYPKSDESTVNFINDKKLSEAFTQLLSVRENIKELTNEENALKHLIQQSMKDSQRAYFLDGEISWKSSADITSINTKALLKDNPELINKYTITKPGARRFLVTEYKE